MAKIPLKEIAHRANVSISTVSRVVSNPDMVQLDTRQKVFLAMEQLGYRLPVKGRPRGRGKGAIAVIIPAIDSEFFHEFLTELQKELTPLGMYTLLIDTQNQYDLSEFLEQDSGWTALVDGIICFYCTVDQRAHRFLMEKGLPVAIVHNRCPYYFSVMNNDYLGGFDAGAHLWERGYRKLGIVAFDSTEADKERDRINGFNAFLQSRKRIDDTLMYDECPIWIEEVSMEGGYRATALALAADQFQALFYLSDTMAIGGMEYCREHGISIPGQLAILGYDDLHLAKAMNLTTMKQFIPDQAKAVVDYLIKSIENPIPDSQPGELTFTPVVVPRSTT